MSIKRGIVYKSTGSWYKVRTEEGLYLDCRVKGKFRMEGKKLTNPVGVGDYVEVEIEEDDTGSIVLISERKNYLVRQSPRKKHYLHLMASNLDQALIVVTWKEPLLKWGFLDRFLLMTQIHDVPTEIIINKCDLLDAQDMEELQSLFAYYESIGYTYRTVSAKEGTGVEAMKESLKDKRTLIAGHSGVGKSSLINAMESGLGIRTNELSDYSGKGQHTTTFAEMFDLSFGGQIIDTPGIKNLSFNHLEKMDVAHNFREFFERSASCKFNDCLHVDEPKCAVLEDLQNGLIPSRRYENYLYILEDIENQNYWEINKDF